MGEKHRTSFVVAADHPSLPGHFPGTAVVPGVVVLDLVLQASERWQGHRLGARGLKQVKFHSPLLPGQRADVSLEIEDGALTFRVTREDQAVAQGTFVLAPDATVP
ncbi:MAG: hypothetical protein WDO68_10365 [Gammaproteobacteria bacterium]